MKRLTAWISVLLVTAQLLLVLLSWLLSAATTAEVRSLLSGEGIRWMMGSFVDVLCSPWLAWLLLLSMAWGCLTGSRLPQAIAGSFVKKKKSPDDYRRRKALRLTLLLFVFFSAIIVWLAFVPHALLLSATGGLFPSSPFSRAAIPLTAFGIVAHSLFFGLTSRSFPTLADAVHSLCQGIAQASPLFLLYVLMIQLYASIGFVFFTYG